jgi:hypothetical protein
MIKFKFQWGAEWAVEKFSLKLTKTTLARLRLSIRLAESCRPWAQALDLVHNHDPDTG